MDDGDRKQESEATVRGAFATLVNERLPAASRCLGWPVSCPDGFERVLLDHAVGAPWETALPFPSIAAATLVELILAIEMGERLIERSACIVRLDDRSKAMRADRAQLCARPAEPDPSWQAVGALFRRAGAPRQPGARRFGLD